MWHIPVHNEMRDRVIFRFRYLRVDKFWFNVKCRQMGKNKPFETSLIWQKTIYIPINSPYKQRINNLAKEIGDTIHIQEIKDVTPKDLFKMINEGKIDFTVCDESVAEIEKDIFQI